MTDKDIKAACYRALHGREETRICGCVGPQDGQPLWAAQVVEVAK